MSELKVGVVKILSVDEHPNADRLELITIKGWQCVGQKGVYKVDDLVVYFPIDSILPEELENIIFGEDSKIKLENHRIRTIKLRGAISQGMVCPLKLFGLEGSKEGLDLTAKLGVTKYEPPVKGSPQSTNIGKATKKQTNPNFRKYTDIENFKNYPDIFTSEDIVYVTEKVHGSNTRAGWVERGNLKWYHKILYKLGIIDKWQFVYGSHNVQLQDKLLGKTYYETNIYAEMVKKYNLKELLPKGYVVYGEICGDGIQKGYTYGCKKGERKLAIFDVMKDGRYLDFLEARTWVEDKGLPTVPLLYRGKFDLEKLKALTVGNSVLEPTQKVIEGVVIKPEVEQATHMGRKVLKLISDEYLLNKNNTEFH